MSCIALAKCYRTATNVLQLMISLFAVVRQHECTRPFAVSLRASSLESRSYRSLASYLPCTCAAEAAGSELSLYASREAILAAAEVGARLVELRETCPLA